MSAIDWTILAIYLAGIVGFGLWAGRRGRTTVEYLLGGRNIPAWAAAISILASEVSAATFIGVPGRVYIGDCTYLQFAFGTLVARFVLAYLLVDIYYRLGVFTVYGYLTSRFDEPTRFAAAGTFLVARLLASGVRLFMGSLPLVVILGVDVKVAIAIMGSAAMLYTVFGGIKAVIWTDVVQASIYMVAAGTTVIVAVWSISKTAGGIDAALDLMAVGAKTRVFDTGAFSFASSTHVVAAITGGLFLTMATHGTDQDMVQRMLTCRTSREGRRSLVTSGWLDFPIVITFLAVGLALWCFYRLVPVDYAVPTGDQDVFPTFITHHLPIGIKGLVIAGLCAAVMASLSTAINALATTTVIDFYKSRRRDASDRETLIASKLATVVWSGLLMGVAALTADIKVANPDTPLIDMALGVMTMVYGSLLGVFLLGIFTHTRGRAATNITGMSVATVVVAIIANRQTAWLNDAVAWTFNGLPDWWMAFKRVGIAWPWYIVIGTVLTFAIGVLGRTRSTLQRQASGPS